MKFLVLTIVMLLSYINPVIAQSNIKEDFQKLAKYMEIEDTDNAERILKSFSVAEVNEFSDSLKCYYHYYSASIDMIKQNTANFQERANHIEHALHYMEIAPNMGIGYYDYPALVLNLGGIYFNMLFNTDKAIKVWEEGLAKCSSVFQCYDDFQKKCYKDIFKGLAKAYKSNGNQVYASLLSFAGEPDIDDYVVSIRELVGKAMELANNDKNYSEAITLLNKARTELSNSDLKDNYYWNQFILSQLAYTYASCHDKTLISVIEELYHLSKNRNIINSFYKVLPNVCSRLTLARDYDMLEYILNIGDQANENDINEEDKLKLTEYRKHLKGYLLFQHNQDSVAHNYRTLDHNSEKWVRSSISLADSYIVCREYDKAIVVSREIYSLLQKNGKNESIAYYLNLLTITDAYLKKLDYESVLPFILETENLTKLYFGEESIQYGMACNSHAKVLINTEFKEAKAYLDIVSKIFAKYYDAESEGMIPFYNNTGRYYMLLNENKSAKENLYKAAELQKKYYGYVEWDTEKWLEKVSLIIKETL